MNKLIVVTGGTKGIGRAVIEKFAANGFDVITCSRNEAELVHLREEIEGRYKGTRVVTIKADLSKKEDAFLFCQRVNETGRATTVLVNNAGYFIPGELVTEQDGVLENMINANLYSAYHVTRGVIGGMIDGGSGHVFNMCSTASIKAYPHGGAYAISKFALLGFSKCLREEVKTHGIRVTAVMPGATFTASWEGSGLPEDRFMAPEDVADAIFSCYSLSGRSVVEEILIRPQLGDI